MENLYESKDKKIVPFLFTCKDIKFAGTRQDGPVIYFQFSPFDKCVELVDQFITHNAPLVQPKDLLDAVETFRDRIFSMKDKRMEYENSKVM